MNKTIPSHTANGWTLVIASAIGALIGFTAIVAKSTFNLSTHQGTSNVDHALSQLQETVRAIQTSTFAPTTTKAQTGNDAKLNDPLLEKHRQNQAGLEVQQIDLRLHRLYHDLVPELDRLEQEILPQEVLTSLGSSSNESAGAKAKQLKVIDDLRRELREKIALLERQKAMLR